MTSIPRRAAFSSNEFLVLTAIFAILIAILIPVASKTRDRARAAVCASNLGQLMNAMYAYADDHDGSFPAATSFPEPSIPITSNTWHARLLPYVEPPADAATAFSYWRSSSPQLTVFTCPTSINKVERLPDSTGVYVKPWYMYGINVDLIEAVYGPTSYRNGINLSIDELLHPSETMAIFETVDWRAKYTREIIGHKNALIPHGMAANVAFYDGSVRRISHTDLVAYPQNSRFWRGGFSE